MWSVSKFQAKIRRGCPEGRLYQDKHSGESGMVRGVVVWKQLDCRPEVSCWGKKKVE